MTALKSLLFFILVPGLLVGYFPWRISLKDAPLFDPSVLRYLAIPFWIVGWTFMIWCFWEFTLRGRGTPAPIDPPKELVSVGLYRHVRNPMYVGGILILLGWVLWSPSLSMAVMPILFFVAAHMFVTLYEEPTLKRKFGGAYENYLKRVPRWLPKMK